MNSWWKNNVVLMILSGIIFVGGYLFLRLAYHMSDKMPFTQEIILIVLGTIATILITAMLLNKQTSVELEKEQSVKFFELKTETYKSLINNIEEILLLDTINRQELLKLRFHTHRLAIVASPEVLQEYRNFLDVLNETILRDKEVNSDDVESVYEALAKLTIFIRSDLIGELDMQSNYTKKEISQQIMENAHE